VVNERVQKQLSYQCLILLGALPVALTIVVPSVASPQTSSIDACATALSRPLKSADAVMLCFDSARSSTFDDLAGWTDVVQRLRGSSNPIQVLLLLYLHALSVIDSFCFTRYRTSV
jgi:hypothetical protein